ncbi:F-BAR domain only protein 2 isoform X2 [Chiloscyllium plagiosum]|uniref:F-BAR domain only protein 2 isoform X2 n=1 Tax=Chiloscyllium plagiosum TaxID=36176 RepID=UPI001CB87644|nr:F-BAR domain only protein 2 isoform X2 [Chiloscyllium plagiosum]
MSQFVDHFWGEKNNGFDVLYHNMKHGQTSTKDLADFIRESVTIEDIYSRSMTKLAKTTSNYSQLGTFAPVWDVLKLSTEKLASSHLDLVRKLQELIKEVQKYGDEQTKAHKKTKEEVAGTLDAVQNIQSITQSLQKSKENYSVKCVEYERLKKEGATQKEIEKAVVKSKKATETYKLYVEKYAAARTDFEQKMTETARKFQEIEEAHLRHMKEILSSFAQSIEETHIQIGQVHDELVQNMESTTVESLIQKFAETKGTGKERPGPVEFEECNVTNALEGVKKSKRKPFGIPGRIKKEKDADSMESPDADSVNIPEVDEEGYCIKPEVNQINAKENNFYSSSDSGSEDEEPRKFHVQIKPVQPNNGTNHTLEELKASIGNITLSPSPSRHSPNAMKRNSSSEELVRPRSCVPSPDSRRVNNDLFSLDPLFGPPLDSSSSSTSTTSSAFPFLPVSNTSEVHTLLASAELTWHEGSSTFSSPISPWGVEYEASVKHQPSCESKSTSPGSGFSVAASLETLNGPSDIPTSRTKWISFTDELNPRKPLNSELKQTAQTRTSPNSNPPVASFQLSSSSSIFDDQSDLQGDFTGDKKICVEENKTGSEGFCFPAAQPVDVSLTAMVTHLNDVSPPARPTTPLNTSMIVPPPRPTSRPKLSAGKLGGINEISRSFSPTSMSSASPPPVAPLARAESTSSIGSSASLSTATTPTIGSTVLQIQLQLRTHQICPNKLIKIFSKPWAFFYWKEKESPCTYGDIFTGKLSSFERHSETPPGTSRGPSPISLGTQDSLPVATAFTESVNAYFKGADPSKCIVKITGDMTMSFPSGIIKVFTSNPSPAVLSFRIRNTSKFEQILPNAQLVYSDPSQNDSNSKDFWMNMQTLTAYLKKLAEQNPSSSYYNVDILKYQVSSNGIQSTPLNLATYWKCSLTTTDIRVDYKYNPEAMVSPSVLSNVQILMPVDGGVTGMQSLPTAVWNAEQKKALWKLSEISEKSENGGSGSLRAKFDVSEGPTKPSTLAVQFLSEGSTLSGADVELVGTGYRLSLIKKRFATGRYMADC